MCKNITFISIVVFLFASAVFAQNNKEIVVTSQMANVRLEPNINSRIVGKVKRGDILKTTAEQENWYYITFGKIHGWIHNSVVEDYVTSKERPINPIFLDDDWIYLAKNDEKSYYYDPKTVSRVRNEIKVWVEARLINTGKKSSQLHMELDCSYKVYRLLSTVEYNSNGTVAKNYEYSDGEWASVPPNSVAEKILQVVCKSIPTPPNENLDALGNLFEIPKTTTKPITQQSGDSPFSSEYVGGDANPSIAVYNDTDRTLTLVFGGVKYVIETKKSMSLTVVPGRYEYTASAPRVQSLAGVDEYKRGYSYTWRFYIVTR